LAEGLDTGEEADCAMGTKFGDEWERGIVSDRALGTWRLLLTGDGKGDSKG